MSEFLPPRMHDTEPHQVAAEEGAPSDAGRQPDATTFPAVPAPLPTPLPTPRKRRGPGPLGRLVSLIITVGLAWALTVAITAWLLGLFLARG